MASTPSPKPSRPQDQSGIALFMVIAAMGVLSLLVTEFTSITHVNQQIAYDGLDQVKAHYLAKSGLKMSLLRLKAYQQVKAFLGGSAAASNPILAAVGGSIPPGLIEKIWNFPLQLPIPPEAPGLTPLERERMAKFNANSGIDGQLSALIESDGSKFNLNQVINRFGSTASSNGSQPPAQPGAPTPGATPSPTPSAVPFNPDEARRSFLDYLGQVFKSKFEDDPDFADEFRDLHVEDLGDAILAWMDRTYDSRLVGSASSEQIPVKRAPFYHFSELHQLPGMQDEIYDVLAEAFSVGMSGNINVNTMNEATLKALFTDLTKDEVTEFFKYRNDEKADHSFKNEEEFYKYALTNFSNFRGDQGRIDEFKNKLRTRGIALVADEASFKVTSTATVNQATQTIEAWVTLKSTSKTSNPTTPGAPPAQPTAGAVPGAPPPDPGLRITFMRLL